MGKTNQQIKMSELIQLTTQLCQQLNVHSFPPLPTLSTNAPITLSLECFEQLQHLDQNALLHQVLTQNRLLTKTGLLFGYYNPDHSRTVERIQPIETQSNASTEAIIDLLVANMVKDENNIVGWCIMSVGTGISVPSTELHVVKACTNALKHVPKALDCLIVVDVMKTSNDKEEGAYLECYDLCQVFQSPMAPMSWQWTVEE